MPTHSDVPVVRITVPAVVAHRMFGWISAHRPAGEWEPSFLAAFLEALNNATAPRSSTAPAVVDVPLPAGPVPEGDRDEPGTMTDAQAEQLKAAFDAAGITGSRDRLAVAQSELNAPELESSAQLSFNQCARLVDLLGAMKTKG